MSATQQCSRTPLCALGEHRFGSCQSESGARLPLGFAGRTPDGEEELGGIGIAGFDERYRLVDGHLEIWFASSRAWIRQGPSKWNTREAWERDAGQARRRLNLARAVLRLFDATGVPAPVAPPPETETPRP